MRLEPAGANLLAIARSTLRDRLLPNLPPAERARAAEVARAMSLVLEDISTDGAATFEHLERLTTARAVLRDRLLGMLPEPYRYDARLVAKAMAIARRELERGDLGPREELARLAALLGDVPPASLSAGELRERLTELNARLCAHIRSGRIDDDPSLQSGVRAFLGDTTLAAVHESHPEYLRPSESAAER